MPSKKKPKPKFPRFPAEVFVRQDSSDPYDLYLYSSRESLAAEDPGAVVGVYKLVEVKKIAVTVDLI